MNGREITVEEQLGIQGRNDKDVVQAEEVGRWVVK